MIVTKQGRHLEGQIPMLMNSQVLFALFSAKTWYRLPMHRGIPFNCSNCCSLIFTCIAPYIKFPVFL